MLSVKSILSVIINMWKKHLQYTPYGIHEALISNMYNVALYYIV